MPVWSWGSDVYGRLGHGTEDQHRGKPTEIAALSNVALTAAVCGSAHNVVVDSSGQVLTWGKCHYGQLGHGEMDQNELIPRPVEALRGIRIRSVGAGDSHVLAVTDDGSCYSWGVGFYGCLGHGDEQSLALPRLVEKLGGEKLLSVSGGAFHSIALTEDGRVLVWGRDNLGQLGMKPLEMPNYAAGGKATKLVRLNKKEPVELQMPTTGKMVAACNNHTLVLLADGRVVSFGDNEHNQLGREKTGETDTPAVIDPSHFSSKPGGPEPVSIISAGWNHCAAITQSGALFTWGKGTHGQLGLGHTRGSRTPQQVSVFPKNQQPVIVHLSCGDSFTVCTAADGTVLAFGSPDYGKLGCGANGCALTAAVVSSAPKQLSGICCGTNHTIAYQFCT